MSQRLKQSHTAVVRRSGRSARMQYVSRLRVSLHWGDRSSLILASRSLPLPLGPLRPSRSAFKPFSALRVAYAPLALSCRRCRSYTKRSALRAHAPNALLRYEQLSEMPCAQTHPLAVRRGRAATRSGQREKRCENEKEANDGPPSR